MNYTDIFSPVKSKIYYSMSLASVAQLLKMSIWLNLIWIVYTLKLDSENFPVLPIISLLIISILFYTIRIYAHDKSHYAAFELEEILRSRLVNKINKLPIETVRMMGAGDLIKVLIDDIKELHAFVADAPPLKAEAFITPVFTLIILFLFNWIFASIVLAITLLTFLLLSFIMRKGKLLKSAYNESTAKINNRIIEYIQGINTVRTFDAGEGSYSQYKKALEEYSNMVFRWLHSVRLSSKFARSLFSPLPVSIILIIGLSMANLNDRISFITTFSFLLLAIGITESIHPVMGLFQIMEKSKASIERIFEIEKLPVLILPKNPQIPNNNEIVFNHVDFAYQGTDSILSNINLRIAENSFTVIIGTSGSGKTTLINLIPRFLDVTKGNITLGGVNIKNIDHNELMSRISFIFQDSFLFSCSIADNIRHGLSNISDEAVIAAAKSAEIHDFIMRLPDQYLPEKTAKTMPHDYNIEFDCVDFTYRGQTIPVLKNISLKIPEKSLTALVGVSGCGKTTITKLILRFADIHAGCIKIGGVDIRHMSQKQLMSLVSVVFQDVYLFQDSIMNNIRMARMSATDEEVIEVCKQANCHDFIQKFKNGYQTQLADVGKSLSGGERQRISIARAILKDAPILILDEPTAALDTQNELAVQKAINFLVQGKTVLVIAHRLSTIIGAKQIFVIDDGVVAESGTHQQLLAKKGIYREFWEIQQKMTV